MTTQEIKDRLWELGLTYSGLARLLNVTDAAITRICNGQSRSKRIEASIARLLQERPEDIFPLETSPSEDKVLEAS